MVDRWRHATSACCALLAAAVALAACTSSPTAKPTGTAPAATDARVLTPAEAQTAIASNTYTAVDGETLTRAAGGSLTGQRVSFVGVIRRVQAGSSAESYVVNGWRARNWLSVDTAPGSAIDGQVSVLYNGDASDLQAGQSAAILGIAAGTDGTTTNGFGARPQPPLIIAEYISPVTSR